MRSIDSSRGNFQRGETQCSGYPQGSRLILLLVSLFLVGLISQVDRVLPFVMAEAIKADLSLSDTEIGLLTGVAGKGKEAMATSLLMVGPGLLGPALGPLVDGMVSDAATAAQIPNGLGLGLLTVPVACVLTGLAMLIGDQRVAAALGRL